MRKKLLGPGTLITAAFIGPGTITTCIKSGYEFGYSLILYMIVATIIAICIQFFSAKIGAFTSKGMSENIAYTFRNSHCKYLIYGVVILAIFIGNSAFEAGNITGASIGLVGLSDEMPISVAYVIIAMIAGLLLWKGDYTIIERFLKVIVIIMVISFVSSAIILNPSVQEILKGITDITFKGTGLSLGVALLGTTIGPYSIFLHSRAAAEHWDNTVDVKHIVFDTIFSIGLGGIISLAIMISSAAISEKANITTLSMTNYASALSEPLGKIGEYVFYIGLFSAGLSSAITAPLAAAYTVVGMTNINNKYKKELLFRFVWALVLIIGLFVTFIFGSTPATIIIGVQIVNAIILPIIIFFLIAICNSNALNNQKNGIIGNIVLAISFAVILLLSSIIIKDRLSL